MPNGGICLHVVFPDQGLFMKPLSGDFFTQGGAKHAKILSHFLRALASLRELYLTFRTYCNPGDATPTAATSQDLLLQL